MFSSKILTCWPVLLVVEAEAVEDLVSDLLLLHTVRGGEVYHLLPALLPDISPAALGRDVVLQVPEHREP